MNSIRLDRGVQFGIGDFETIAVWDHKAIFLSYHLERLENGMKALGIKNPEYHRDAVLEKMRDITKLFDKTAVKIIVTEENLIYKLRDISDDREHYEKGFHLCFSDVMRNTASAARLGVGAAGDGLSQQHGERPRLPLPERGDDILFGGLAV